MPLLSVSQTKHRSLYHYQPYTEDWRGYLEATLRDRTIYLPSPSYFNDPWDCRPWFDLAVLDDAVMRERHIEWYMRVAIKPVTEHADELRQNRPLLNHFVEETSRRLWARIDHEYRLYCLTPNCDDLLMWSHYANKHKGVCLQFDARTDPISAAFKVSYQDQLPCSIIPEHGEDDAEKALLTKSDAWDYEEEFRLIARDSRVPPLPNTLIATDGILPIGDRSLVGIIVGCQCNGADEIIDMVRRHQPSITVRQAKRQAHRYGLVFETLPTGV